MLLASVATSLPHIHFMNGAWRSFAGCGIAGELRVLYPIWQGSAATSETTLKRFLCMPRASRCSRSWVTNVASQGHSNVLPSAPQRNPTLEDRCTWREPQPHCAKDWVHHSRPLRDPGLTRRWNLLAERSAMPLGRLGWKVGPCRLNKPSTRHFTATRNETYRAELCLLQFAVLGSIRRLTADMRFAGNPVRRACSRTVSSSGAR